MDEQGVEKRRAAQSRLERSGSPPSELALFGRSTPPSNPQHVLPRRPTDLRASATDLPPARPRSPAEADPRTSRNGTSFALGTSAALGIDGVLVRRQRFGRRLLLGALGHWSGTSGWAAGTYSGWHGWPLAVRPRHMRSGMVSMTCRSRPRSVPWCPHGCSDDVCAAGGVGDHLVGVGPDDVVSSGRGGSQVTGVGGPPGEEVDEDEPAHAQLHGSFNHPLQCGPVPALPVTGPGVQPDPAYRRSWSEGPLVAPPVPPVGRGQVTSPNRRSGSKHPELKTQAVDLSECSALGLGELAGPISGAKQTKRLQTKQQRSQRLSQSLVHTVVYYPESRKTTPTQLSSLCSR